jgi:hypothetical protein
MLVVDVPRLVLQRFQGEIELLDDAPFHSLGAAPHDEGSIECPQSHNVKPKYVCIHDPTRLDTLKEENKTAVHFICGYPVAPSPMSVPVPGPLPCVQDPSPLDHIPNAFLSYKEHIYIYPPTHISV